ncbi:MAG: hypothetical protein PHH26_04545 [Candidatus Thermoplasmatota archaeon]|nr:hypothetical protein [Candidatus Thermoplasmatota archaeon]
MRRKLKHTIASAWILGIIFILLGIPAFAESPRVEEVLRVLGMDKGQIAELAQGQPVAYALREGSADELAVGLVWYLPVSLDKVTGQLRLEDTDPLDVDVTAHGILTEHSGASSLAHVVLSKEEAQALLDAEPGDEFNLSAHEIDKLKAFKETLKRTPQRAIEDAAGEHFREILLQRYKAYRRGGTNAIAPYARKESTDSKPSLELRQAANASAILSHYFPALHKVWLDYPKALPPGVSEVFPWVEKNVEGRPAAILRHRININWNGGVLVLTREIYALHSYNSSQWITGSLPYRGGTVVFQQVRSFTDQVAGVASDVKHIVGRELLKDKMLKSFDRLCNVLGQCN